MIDLVKKWASDRNLIKGSTPEKQMLKMNEELGELCGAIARGNQPEKVKDGLGDCLVVLIILAEQLGYDLNACLEHSYNEIKDRKGEMRDGVFVKEEDLA